VARFLLTTPVEEITHMRRVSVFGVWAACAALTVACGTNQTAENNENTGAKAPAAAEFRGNASDRPAPVDVSGCITASGDQYVLTSLENAAAAPGVTRNENGAADRNAASNAGAAAQPTTETYQLVGGNADDLRKYVGRQVRVTGEADPARVAEVREATPATPAIGTSGQPQDNANGAAKVTTEEKTRFEMRKLRVSSVTGAGGECPAR
jgi:hypothetical protein